MINIYMARFDFVIAEYFYSSRFAIDGKNSLNSFSTYLGKNY